MILNVQFLTGNKGIVSGLEESDTVADLKARVAELKFAPAPADQKLLFGGKLLSDDSVTLAELDIFGETCIMCVSNPKPQAAGAPSTGAPAKADQPEPKEVTEDPEPDANPAPANGERVPADDNGGGGGGAAKNGVPAPANEDDVESKNDSGADEEEMVTLSLKTLRGTSSLIEVPAHATFGHIKHKYIQPIEDIPAIQMRLIYMGQLTDDSKTPFDYNVCNESFIHLVRRPNESIKNEVITKLKLMANCRWCNKAGVQLVLRPQCRECGNEGAMYKDRVIEVGKSKWADLENLKGICFHCGPAGKEVDLSMGFLCTGQPGSDGPTCPSRIPTARKMIHTFEGGDLVESLNQIFGYAHARGFEV